MLMNCKITETWATIQFGYNDLTSLARGVFTSEYEPTDVLGPYTNETINVAAKLKLPLLPLLNDSLIYTTNSFEDVVSILVQNGCKDLTDCIPTDGAPTIAYAYGGACDVYEWKLRESISTDTISFPIAIKILRCSSQSNAEARLLKRAAKELFTWLQLDRHPNILPLLGLAVFHGRLSMVSPWMPNGNLAAYLRRRENSNVDRIEFCEQIRAGLVYIHSKDMVHGDLKPANIMVSNEGRALIADFGNAILKDLALSFAPTTTFGMTYQYAPPEHLASENMPIATKQSDVYSFGMTVYEILTGEIPFADKNSAWIIGQASRGKLLPSQPSTIDDGIWSILLPCWAHDPLKRPFVSDIQFPVFVPAEFKEFGDLLSPLIHICGDRFASVFGQSVVKSESLPQNNHNDAPGHGYEHRKPDNTLGSSLPNWTPPCEDGLEVDMRELFRVWTKGITARFSLTSFQWFKGSADQYLLFNLRNEETSDYPRKELWFRLGYRPQNWSASEGTGLTRLIGRWSGSGATMSAVVSRKPAGDLINRDPELHYGRGVLPDCISLYYPPSSTGGKSYRSSRERPASRASVVFSKRLPLSYLLDALKIINNEPLKDGQWGAEVQSWFYASIIVEILDKKVQNTWQEGNRKFFYDHWGSKKWVINTGKYDRIMDQIRQLEA
ncbi:unnamed protein product [Rhizoctonia solani]|uniref:Protein kinase domain-containing protein n=1 Tax=Rhizoctonia solani TaxID=456999 RepID=A0A8H3D4K3_9AGAM|nr:unnamed protein product [Rhizoctonia solani]